MKHKKNIVRFTHRTESLCFLIFIVILTWYLSANVSAKEKLFVVQPIKKTESKNKKLIPEKFWGKYYLNSVEECTDSVLAFESLLSINKYRIVFGSISSCEVRKIIEKNDYLLLYGSCRSEADSSWKGKFQVSKLGDNIVIDEQYYQHCKD